VPFRTKVTDFLNDRKIPYSVKHHSKAVFTSEEAAVERGVRLSQVVKTMLLGAGEFMAVAVLPSHRRLDTKKLKRVTGNKNLQFMDKDAIEQKTGLTVGAVSPVGCGLESFPIYVDPSVFKEEFLDISSGDPRAGLGLYRDDLKGLLKEAHFVDIVKEEK
jgi:Cys-tRNA(Pro) deacylase